VPRVGDAARRDTQRPIGARIMDVQLTLVIPVGLHAQAEALARRLGLTRSALYAEALADFLDLHGEAAGAADPGDEEAQEAL